MKSLRYWLLCIACVTVACGWSQNLRINLENEPVSRYMAEVTYTDESDTSKVWDFIPIPFLRCDLPQVLTLQLSEKYKAAINSGLIKVLCSTDINFSDETTEVIDVKPDQYEVKLYGLVPGQVYYYRILMYTISINQGRIITDGQVRMLHVPSISNVRDIGGWKTADGRTVRYGKIFRGGELNGMHQVEAEDLQRLLHLGIGAELDLRADYEESHNVSAFGFKSASQVLPGEVPTYLYTSNSGQLISHLTQYSYLQRWKQSFQFIVQNLRVGRAIYQHCRWGADRTGYISLLLEGLLGVTYDGLVKDYELTTFAMCSLRAKTTIDPIISYIRTLDGETLQQQFYTFWKNNVGVSDAEIKYFMSEMLEGEPQPIDVTTGVTDVQPATQPATVRYDLQGRRLNGHRSGLVIERQANGTSRKKMVRTN